jgi:hypothetical protein
MLLAGDDAAPACCAAGAAVGGDWARSCVGKKEAIIITRCLIIGCLLCGVPDELIREPLKPRTCQGLMKVYNTVTHLLGET